MPQVMITCPETGKPVYTGMNFDWYAFEWIQVPDSTIECPKCGEVHQWDKTDAYLRADGGEG